MVNKNPLLSVIIISFNTSFHLRNCLSSVYKSLKSDSLLQDSEVLVVDNASTDTSVQMVNDVFPQVKLVRNKSNTGFAKANNQAMKIARGKYLLLLNSDTIVGDGLFIHLLNTFKSDQSIGAVGPKLLNGNGTLQPSAGYFPTLPKIFFWMSLVDDVPVLNRFIKPYHVNYPGFYGKSAYVDWVSGACLMVRKEAIDKAGMLDEKIFMYGEEVDWCYRIISSGFRVYYQNSVSVFHFKGKSGEGSLAGIVEEYKFIRYFYRKYFPGLRMTVACRLLRFGALLRIILFGIIMQNRPKRSLYAKAIQVV